MGGFEFSHFSPQNLDGTDGKSGVPPPGRNMPRAQRSGLDQPCARPDCDSGDGPGWMVWGDKHCLACLAPPWQGRRQPWALLGAWSPWQPFSPLTDSPWTGSTGNPYCGEARPGERFSESQRGPVRVTVRLDLTALEWIPLTYSLPDPGWPRLVGKMTRALQPSSAVFLSCRQH